jgi:hypothetical protein
MTKTKKRAKAQDKVIETPAQVTREQQAASAPKEKQMRVPKPIGFAAEKEARAVGPDTKLGALLASLSQGVTMEQLIEVLSKSGSPANPGVVRSWIAYDVKRCGYGVRQYGNLFYLVFPDGMTEVAYKVAEPKQATEVTVKAAGSSKPKSKKARAATS